MQHDDEEGMIAHEDFLGERRSGFCQR